MYDDLKGMVLETATAMFQIIYYKFPFLSRALASSGKGVWTGKGKTYGEI